MPTDTVGDSLVTAKAIFPIATPQALSEYIGADAGAIDAADYYRFTLARSSSFTLSLTGTTANANVQLLNSAGVVVTDSNGIQLSSTNTGTLSESINSILAAGTYYIAVTPGPATNLSDPLNTTPSTNYTLNVAADSNTKTGLVWRNSVSGEDIIWTMDGTSLVSYTNTSGVNDPNWRIQATGDFNSDSNTDLVWRNSASGQNIIWLMNGDVRSSIVFLPTIADLNWQIQAAGDFNKDGTIDLVWRNYASGGNVVWQMNGTTLNSFTFFESNLNLGAQIQGVADFNNDGSPDILWRSTSAADRGSNYVWLMNGITRVSTILLPQDADLNWNQAGTGDYNNDGKPDIFWRNLATGENRVWFLDGTTFRSSAPILTINDPNWRALSPFYRYLAPVRADVAGNTAATSFSIGPLNGNGVYHDLVNDADQNDYYQFTLGSVTQFNLTLNGPNGSTLSGDADLRLFDNAGNLVGSSVTDGGASEAIAIDNLAPGTYSVQVSAKAGGGSLYDLSFAANNLPVLAAKNVLSVSEGAEQTIDNSLLLVTDENNTPAQLTYSLTTAPDAAKGSLSLNGAAITAGSQFTQADINSRRLTYRQNGSEALADSFVFTVSDGAGGTLPNAAFPNTTFSINVVPANDPPTLSTNAGLTLSEGTAAAITSLGLAVTDVEQSPAQLIYILNSPPSSGNLSLNGAAIVAGSSFTQADINSGTRLSYSHSGTETTSDSFTFTVTDGAGGTLSAAPTAFNIAINPVNDLPVLITNRGLTVTEGTSPTITSSLLQASDAELTAPSLPIQLPDQLIYTLVNLPTRGTLFLGNNAINSTLTAAFTQADINNNRLLYSHDGSKTNSDSFVFRLSDGTGTTANSTFNIIVSPINSTPVLVSNPGLTLNEGAALSITGTQLLVSDADNPPPQITYTLNQRPVNGNLKLNGVALADRQTFTQQDISNPSGSRLTYEHNGSETVSDSFVFVASDPSGAAIPTTTVNIAVNPSNDSPTLQANLGLTVSEGAIADLTTLQLSATDVDNLSSQITFTASTPIAGTLLLAGTAVNQFTQADIASGQLKYQHNGNESTSDSFTFNVTDSGGTSLNPSGPRTFNIAVLPVNDAPGVAVNTALPVSEGSAATITSTSLQITDNDGPGPLTYTIGTAPARGSLRLGTTSLTANQTFTQADIAAGRLSYTHDGSETTADSFTFTASDGATGTIPLSTFNIAVTLTNDLPTIVTNAGLSLSEGAALTITNSLLQVSDGDNPPPTSLVYTATTPASGALLLGGVATSTFTQADINNGLVTYQHNGSESTIDNFTFTVTDGVVATPIGPNTVNISITSINDTPGLSLNTGLTVSEGAATTITNTVLLITDNDGPGPLTYTIGTAPTRGSLQLRGTALTANQTFTQADIAAGRLSYSHNGTETTADSFTFTASDSSTGTIALTTFNLTVTPINDAPVLTVPGFQVVDEDISLPFTGANRISVSDADIGGNPLTVTLAASGGTLSLNPGSLTVTNNATSSVTIVGQLTALNNALGTLAYQGLPDFNGTDTIVVTVSDGGSSGAGGVQIDSRTIDVNVNPINDAPTLTVPGAQTLLEDTEKDLATLITATDTDSGNSPVKVTLSATNGFLTLVTTAGLGFVENTANSSGNLVFTGTIASVRAALNTLKYQGNPNYFGTDTISLRIDDQGSTGAPGAASILRTIPVTITPVNDQPSFTLGQNQVINEDAGAQTVPWATNISAGAANESSQTLNFTVSNNNASLFTVAPAIDPITGNLSYTPVANANGTATVTVSLRDNGGTVDGGIDTTPSQTFTIAVNPVNDAPAFVRGADQTVNEDAGAQTVANWATGISRGPADEAGQNLTFLTSTNNDALFTVGPAIDASGTLTYTPAANANGAAIVTVRLQDDGGTDRGGINTTAAQTFTINVAAVNDPPVFVVPGSQTVDEDADLFIPNISLTDSDAGTNEVRVTLALTNTANSGTIRLGSTSGLTITGGANNSSSISFRGTIANINTALSNLAYRGGLNFNGTDTLTLTADDQGFTGTPASGTIDTKTINITVRAINDAPVATAPASISVDEDTDLQLSGISVADIDAASVQVTLSATRGILTFANTTGLVLAGGTTNGSGTVSFVGTLADINTALAGSNLTYRASQNYSGPDTITVTTSDWGAAGFGGTLTDTRTIAVTVNAVNDAPVITVPAAQTVNEDTDLVFTGSRAILITDIDAGTSPIQVVLSVSNGTLTLGSVTGAGAITGNGTRTVTYTGTVAALAAPLSTLTYRGTLNYSGSDTLNVSVTDQGNTGSGPVGTDAKSINITIGQVNDAPVLVTNRTLTLSENSTVAITNSQLRTTDVDTNNSLLVYSIVNPPDAANGNLRLFNPGTSTFTTLGANSSFTQADINSGYLSYVQNGSESSTDSFTFSVTDGGNTIPTTGLYTFNLAINTINDAPTVVNNSPLNVTEGGTGFVTNTLLSVSDPDNSPTQRRYTLNNTPNNGSLRLNGGNLGVGQSFSQADIDGNRISYRHNGSETTSDSFIFTVNDGAGGSTGTRTFRVAVSRVNDAPVIVSSGPATVSEGATLSLTNTLLRTSDPDNLTSDIRYTIPTVPVSGTLLLDGVPLTSNAVFTQQAVNEGLLTYEHNGSEPNTNDVFIFRVSDGTVTLPDRVFTIAVNPVNDPPTVVNNNGITINNASLPSLTTISSDQLLVTDIDTDSTQLVYSLTATPDSRVGVLRLNGTALSSGQSFTQADIDSGNLSYDYFGNGTTESFQFTVSDGGTGGTLSTAYFYISFNYV